MHIVKFQGGLGNQMFQYALYRKFQSMGYDTYADLYHYRQKKYETRPLQLSVFGIDLREADRADVIQLSGNEDRWFDIVWLKHIGKKTYYREKDISYKEEIWKMTNGYFHGFWQSEKYFYDIEDILRNEFVLSDTVQFDLVNRQMQLKIKEDQKAVSVHIRRGDYLENPMYGGICTEEYYKKAIDYIKQRVENAKFYLFSNDMPYVQDRFRGEEFVYVENNSEDKGYIDLYLMSLCKHHIIANSSFSWWGAWLNAAKSKIVVAPSIWLTNAPARDVVPDTWIRC
jgi:hypothetical protein